MKKIKNKNLNSKRIFYITAVAWPIIQFLVFYLYVNFNSILLAVQEFDYYEGTKFVWFANFRQVLIDFVEVPYMSYALKNTFVVFFISLLLMFLPIILAYYLFKKYPLSGTFKTFLFLPHVVSSMALVLCYKYFVIKAVPEIGSQVFNVSIPALLDDNGTRWVTLLFYHFWIGMGGSFLLYLGAMTGISEAIFEAAQLDGVGPVREFTKIVFPLIYPTYMTFVITSFATLFTNQVNLFTFFGANAEHADYTIGYILYAKVRTASLSQYPYYAAMGILLTLIVIPLCLGTRKLMSKFDPTAV